MDRATGLFSSPALLYCAHAAPLRYTVRERPASSAARSCPPPGALGARTDHVATHPRLDTRPTRRTALAAHSAPGWVDGRTDLLARALRGRLPGPTLPPPLRGPQELHRRHGPHSAQV